MEYIQVETHLTFAPLISSFSCGYWLKILKFFEGFLYPKRAKGTCRIAGFKSRRISQHPCQAQEVTKTMVNRAIAVTMDELAEKEPSLHLRQMRLSDAAKEVLMHALEHFLLAEFHGISLACSHRPRRLKTSAWPAR